ncbi:MAG: hypothetical protein ACLUJG_08450 [Lawsonibacter sp.]
MSKRDGELACDEGGAPSGEDQRIPYGRTLVGMVAQRSLRPCRSAVLLHRHDRGQKTIQQRIALLVKHPETRAAAVFGACVALALVAVFTFGRRFSPHSHMGYYDQFPGPASQRHTDNPSFPIQRLLSRACNTAPSVEAPPADLLCPWAPTSKEARRRWNEDDFPRRLPDHPDALLRVRRPHIRFISLMAS